ncbi:MAG: hypothetical protein KAU02_05715 [Tenericutes bacterium]|nr:hypothetical protein [Mycoplasmatota bacterium]
MRKKQNRKTTIKSIIRKISIIIGVVAIIIVPIMIFNPRVSFEATVINANSSTIFVLADEDSSLMGRFFVTISEDTKIIDESGDVINASDIGTNDVLKITYDGEVQESEPGKIQTCYKIRIIG